MLSGVYRPQSGRVTFNGIQLIGKRPHEIAELGVARTFQNIELFSNLTVLDNLMLGRHHHDTYGVLSSFVWLGKARRCELLNREAVSSWSSGGGSPSGNCPTACRNASSSAAHWPCGRSSCCSTSRSPG